jgi:hypothetical protein
MKRLVTALDGVTATTTSSAINIRYAKKVTFVFTRADNAGGTSTFTVSGSIDGTTYVDLNKLVTNVANANTETVVRVASVAIANTNASSIASLDLEYDVFEYIKVTVTETSDGTHTAKVYIETDEDD